MCRNCARHWRDIDCLRSRSRHIDPASHRRALVSRFSITVTAARVGKSLRRSFIDIVGKVFESKNLIHVLTKLRTKEIVVVIFINIKKWNIPLYYALLYYNIYYCSKYTSIDSCNKFLNKGIIIRRNNVTDTNC